MVGTILAAVMALPLSFFGARNIVGSKLLCNLIRFIFDLCRGISEIVLGLLFVTIVGLGPFAGVMALAVHELGALGRYFSEAIENIPPHILDIGKSSGAHKLQIISRILIPELRPILIGYVLYYFEHSVRAATVLGLVGAGGIGLLLLVKVKLFLYREVAAILIVIILLVVASDRISFLLRIRSRKMPFQE
jgi:phosphonate transport system permease protein